MSIPWYAKAIAPLYETASRPLSAEERDAIGKFVSWQGIDVPIHSMLLMAQDGEGGLAEFFDAVHNICYEAALHNADSALEGADPRKKR